MASVVCADGVAVDIPTCMVEQCGTLKHMYGDCPATCVPVPVPFGSDTVDRMKALCDNATSLAALELDARVALLRAADFLDAPSVMRAVTLSLAQEWAKDVALMDCRDIPIHLLCSVARELPLDPLCAIAVRAPEMGECLQPWIEKLTTDITFQQAVEKGHLAVCQWLTHHRQLTRLGSCDGHLLTYRYLISEILRYCNNVLCPADCPPYLEFIKKIHMDKKFYRIIRKIDKNLYQFNFDTLTEIRAYILHKMKMLIVMEKLNKVAQQRPS